jgi:hypothetical protein
MKLLTVVIWMCLSALTAAPAQAAPVACAHCFAAPAPLIGTGIPAVLVVGGVLLGATLLKGWRRS